MSACAAWSTSSRTRQVHPCAWWSLTQLHTSSATTPTSRQAGDCLYRLYGLPNQRKASKPHHRLTHAPRSISQTTELLQGTSQLGKHALPRVTMLCKCIAVGHAKGFKVP